MLVVHRRGSQEQNQRREFDATISDWKRKIRGGIVSASYPGVVGVLKDINARVEAAIQRRCYMGKTGRNSPKSNLTPRKRGGSPRRVLTSAIDKFCIHYKLIGNAKQAAIAAGMSASSAFYLLADPRIQKRLEEVDREMLSQAVKMAEQKFAISEEFLDEQLSEIAADATSHKYRGSADRVKAIEVGYKKLGLIESGSKVTVNNKQQQLRIQTNGTFYDVYKSKWLLEKEAEMAKRAQKEYDQSRIAAGKTLGHGDSKDDPD